MRSRALALLSVSVVALVVAGCGESKNDKAKKEICSARSNIQETVKSLSSLTASTITVDGVKSDLESLQKDLKTIRDQQGNLDDTRKSQVEAASKQFGDQVQSIAKNLVVKVSLADSEQALKAAGAQLQTAFQQALQPIDCS